MPPVSWPTDPSSAVVAFEKLHSDSEAGALLPWACSSVEALDYLADFDAAYEASRIVPGGHPAHVVDVAHARWATSTCITALDLGTASLARALGGHPGPKELDLGNFSAAKPSKAVVAVVASMPPLAMNWIRAVIADPAFVEMKEARDALTHRRLRRHLYLSKRRLDLQVGTQRLPVRQLIENAHDLAIRHITDLLTLLPVL
jgi:hypothetical protein